MGGRVAALGEERTGVRLLACLSPPATRPRPGSGSSTAIWRAWRSSAGLSQNTVDGYRNDLSRLGEALAKKGGRDLLTADAADLSAHLRDLQRQGLSPRSSARALSAIRGFYEHLVTPGERTDNPAVNLLPPKLWKPLPKVLSEDEVEALLAAPDVATPLGLRDRAMFELLYATGLRVSELVGLDAAAAPARRRLPDRLRQGEQGAGGAGGGAGRALGAALPARRPPRAGPGAPPGGLRQPAAAIR